ATPVTSVPGLVKIGTTDALCPYCSVALAKFPGRKTKCKSCEQYIYVRTRPLDSQRILVKEDELPIVEEQWAIKNDTWDDLQENRAELQEIRNELRKKFGREPANNDVLW